MKNKKLLTLTGSICLILVLAALPFMAACAKPAPTPTPAPPTPAPAPAPVPTPKPEPIVLRATSFLPVHLSLLVAFGEYVKRVNEAAKGELIINWIGGPEVIPAFDQDEAVKTGAMDMACTAGGYYEGILPEAEAIPLTTLTPWEEREVGYYDAMVEAHKKINVLWIGRSGTAKQYYLYTNIKVDHPQELRGQRMRSGGLYEPFMKALGVTPIVMPTGDVYTALERGLVDGYAETSTMVSRGWHEVCKYMILPGFYRTNTVTLMNLDKFNSLPAHLQKLLLDVQKDFEPWEWDYFTELESGEIQKTKDAGVQFIEFTGEDAKWFLDLAYKSKWDSMRKRAPEFVDKVLPMLEK